MLPSRRTPPREAAVESTVASLITSAEQGDAQAAEALFAALYAELHRMAERRIARDGRHLTLGATTLLHETYLSMAQREAAFPDSGRFMAYAARVMRALIVDYVRRRRAQKRGGQLELTPLEDDVAAAAEDQELVRLSEAVDALAQLDPALAQVVDLRCRGGAAARLAGRGRPLPARAARRSRRRPRQGDAQARRRSLRVGRRDGRRPAPLPGERAGERQRRLAGVPRASSCGGTGLRWPRGPLSS